MASSHGSSQVIQVPQDYKTIQEAIDAAPPGSTIVAHYEIGMYRENLKIKKPLHLYGLPFAVLEADPQEPAVLIENAGPVTVANFLLHRRRQELAHDVTAPYRSITVSLPELLSSLNTPVRVSTPEGEAVRETKGIVAQGTTQVFLEGNKFTGWAMSICIASGASAVLTNNTIETDAVAEHIKGIAVEDAEAKIIGNQFRIRSSIEFVSGIDVVNSQVQIKENEIYILEGSRDGAAGLGLVNTTGEISANRIIVRRADGIVIYGSRGLTVRDNMIVVTTPAVGIVISGTERSPKNEFIRIQGNKLMGTLQQGSGISISVLSSTAPEIHENIITNFETGVSITLEAQAHLRGNLLVGNQDGVVIRRDAVKTSLYENKIWNNRGCGVRIEKTLPQWEKLQGIEGQGNWLADNGRGDLCPPDYPWPPGFQK